MTGTFDNWAKTVKLDKIGEAFEKTVELPKSDEKIYYKVGDVHLYKTDTCGPWVFYTSLCTASIRRVHSFPMSDFLVASIDTEIFSVVSFL